MNPTARDIADAIVDGIKQSGEPVNYETEITRILCVDYNYSSAVAAEHVEKLSGRVHARLRELHWRKRELNLTPDFQFSDNDRRFLVPSERFRPGHHRRRDAVLNILRNCPWRKFEAACCKLLELSKCTKFGVGAGTKEGGLDFYALLHIGALAPEKKMLFDWRVRIFGQAKHWGSKVGESNLRTFNDQLHDFAVRHEGKAYKKAFEWFRSDESPVLGVFVGLEGFTTGARTIARRNGIITRDGEQLAEFFADAVPSNEITLEELGKLLT